MKFFKKKVKRKYIFFCKTCDIFFAQNKTSGKCPLCGRKAELRRVEEFQEEN